MDLITLALAKGYTKKLYAGYSSVEIDGMNIIFTLVDGNKVTLTVPAPKDGVGIKEIKIENKHLICVLSDNTAIDVGELPKGEKGDKGDPGPVYDDTQIQEKVDEAIEIAKGANQSLSVPNYFSLVEIFNNLQGNEYKIGQNIYILTLEVPDLWISEIKEEFEEYIYVSDEDFMTSLKIGGVQVGHYVLSALETQKVDLSNYIKNTDIASSTKAGVAAFNSNYALAVNAATSSPIALIRTAEQYETMSTNAFIGKGTLENIKNEYVKQGMASNMTYDEETQTLTIITE